MSDIEPCSTASNSADKNVRAAVKPEKCGFFSDSRKKNAAEIFRLLGDLDKRVENLQKTTVVMQQERETLMGVLEKLNFGCLDDESSVEIPDEENDIIQTATRRLLDQCCSVSILEKGDTMTTVPTSKSAGILAVECYFPKFFVDQTELEQHDKVSAGKYTVGLGQKRMGFCTDLEDVNSLCLTVVRKLIEKNNIDVKTIGHLCVGTETIADKSKSVKSVVMQLLEELGNTDVEGTDSINACFGGTQALFNAVNWIDSAHCDGRNAIVLMADIASYAEGPARCTGGAGAVAFLIGPNAPIVFDVGLRAFHMKHAYDFYKPNPFSEYPVVDGKLSIDCFLNSLITCFDLYKSKAQKIANSDPTLDSFFCLLFHAPFCKLVQKSVAKLKQHECLSKRDSLEPDSAVQEYKTAYLKNDTKNFDEKRVEKLFMDYSKPLFDSKTKVSLFLAENIGNMYTSSLYGGLISVLINKNPADVAGTKFLLFSYGSGLCSCMYSVTVSDDHSANSQLVKLMDNLKKDVFGHLETRTKKSPEFFVKSLKQREEAYGKAPYKPVGEMDSLFSGTYFLTHIDKEFRRFYDRKLENQSCNGNQ